MPIDNAETPQELFEAIREMLIAKDATIDAGSISAAYRAARTKIVTFRGIWSALPDLPPHNPDSVAGLQECMDWCTRAKPVIEDILGRIDGQLIRAMISVLEQMKALPQESYPRADMALFDKAVKRVQRITGKWVARGRAPRKIPFHRYHIIGRANGLARAAFVMWGIVTLLIRPRTRFRLTSEPSGREEAHFQVRTLIQGERLYRLMDHSYDNALVQFENMVRDKLGEYNELACTPRGKLLDTYDKLTGGPIDKAVEGLTSVWQTSIIDSLVDDELLLSLGLADPHLWSALLSREPVDSLIGKIIAALEDVGKRQETLEVLENGAQDMRPGPKERVGSEAGMKMPTGQPNEQGQASEPPAGIETNASFGGKPPGNDSAETLRQCAQRVEGLLEPMEIPTPTPTWESEAPGFGRTNRQAQRIASEHAKALRLLKAEYRKKVVDVLEDGWEPVADIIEESVPHTLGKLEGWRKDILDHTDPAREHAYWLEPRDGKLVPNKHLKDTIDKLAGKLRSRADYVERTARRTNAPGQTSETAADPWRVCWDEKDTAYMQSGEARVHFSDGKPSASTLSRKLGRIPVHYMTAPGKGCRVHIADYRIWAQKEYPSDSERDEIASEYMADIEARKAAAQRNKRHRQ